MSILPFPTTLTAPVQQQGRPGRHPKGIVSLHKVRFERYCVERRAEETRQKSQQYLDQAEALINKAEVYLYAVFKLRGMVSDTVDSDPGIG